MICVTKPFLPPLEESLPYLQQIWDSKILTNGGPFHLQLEEELCKYLGVEYISLFSNGTLALITALQALNISGEVLTTPFSFVATTHSLWWNNIKPIFVDIDPITCNIDPDKLEAAITPYTTAILPVHVYGIPCINDAIEHIATKHNLKVIYDAAHAFGVKQNNKSILNFGDLSILSFHATKVFNTFEGGAIICKTAEMKQHIDDLKNFGFRNETEIVAPGINAKMNEFQASMGLVQLKYIDSLIAKRKMIAEKYQNSLQHLHGITFLNIESNITYNYAYFPIFVDKFKLGVSRDHLYEKLKHNQIHTRRYFYPLISQLDTYKHLASALPGTLPNAERITEEVLCLPIYPDLALETVETICELIQKYCK